MMRWLAGLLLIAACTSAPEIGEHPGSTNKWSDPDLQLVLQAQDRRDVETLCRSLEHPRSEVRKQAALAFASVALIHGPMACACLMSAFQDTSAEVRRAAAIASAYAADSVSTILMAEMAKAEKDPVIQKEYLSASFIAMQRHNMLTPNAILYLLQNGTETDRVRAADALRRMEDTAVQQLGKEIDELLRSPSPDVRQYLILALRKLNDTADVPMLRDLVLNGSSSGERINALRVLDKIQPDTQLLLDLLDDPILGSTAIEQLQNAETLDVKQLLDQAMAMNEDRLKAMLLGLVIKHGDEMLQQQSVTSLEDLRDHRSAYVRAEVITALSFQEDDHRTDALMQIMTSDASAPEKQAAFQGAIRRIRERMARSRYTSIEAQYEELSKVTRMTIETDDPGLISAAAEELLKEGPEAIKVMVDEPFLTTAKEDLKPIEDLEARRLIDMVVAKMRGIEHAPEPIVNNHQIDMARLATLRNGQRYRMITSKGTIDIRTDVDAAPGTVVAFDSLVTAGFYNGKAFHRVVPNFVIQTGCPRGDGYGGMPWTLRTEISDRLFKAGSLGMASAGPDTEGSQFFITHSATPHLDGRYTNFGEVVEGMDVVWRIQVGDVIERIEKVQ